RQGTGAARAAPWTTFRARRDARRHGEARRPLLSGALMLRAGLLYLSEQPSVFKFVRSNGLAKRFASRFVAGETLDTAVAAVRELNARRITASLDLLGESVAKAEEATAAKD